MVNVVIPGKAGSAAAHGGPEPRQHGDGLFRLLGGR